VVLEKIDSHFGTMIWGKWDIVRICLEYKHLIMCEEVSVKPQAYFPAGGGRSVVIGGVSDAPVSAKYSPVIATDIVRRPLLTPPIIVRRVTP
jgi:hypothetical protein